MTPDRRKEVIDVWKAIVGVQMHFNDIAMRIRSMFVTILLALFASIGFLLDKKWQLEIWRANIQFTTFIPIFGILGTYLFYFIDRYWYHRLLVGSVKHAIKIEGQYKDKLPELSLSDAIGAESPYKPNGIAKLMAWLVVSDKRFKETKQLHSDGKIEFFYKSIMVALCVTFLILGFLGGITLDPSITDLFGIASVPDGSWIAPPSEGTLPLPDPALQPYSDP
jgi:hypothetical protein